MTDDPDDVLYYEGHVILRPAPDAVESTMNACLSDLKKDGWWYSVLEMEHGPDRAEQENDLILTTRAPTQPDLLGRISLAAGVALNHGFEVIRYKIEAATIDSKCDDVLGILA